MEFSIVVFSSGFVSCSQYSGVDELGGRWLIKYDAQIRDAANEVLMTPRGDRTNQREGKSSRDRTADILNKEF